MKEYLAIAIVFLIVGIVIGCAWANRAFATLINKTFPE